MLYLFVQGEMFVLSPMGTFLEGKKLLLQQLTSMEINPWYRYQETKHQTYSKVFSDIALTQIA